VTSPMRRGPRLDAQPTEQGRIAAIGARRPSPADQVRTAHKGRNDRYLARANRLKARVLVCDPAGRPEGRPAPTVARPRNRLRGCGVHVPPRARPDPLLRGTARGPVTSGLSRPGQRAPRRAPRPPAAARVRHLATAVEQPHHRGGSAISGAGLRSPTSRLVHSEVHGRAARRGRPTPGAKRQRHGVPDQGPSGARARSDARRNTAATNPGPGAQPPGLAQAAPRQKARGAARSPRRFCAGCRRAPSSDQASTEQARCGPKHGHGSRPRNQRDHGRRKRTLVGGGSTNATANSAHQRRPGQRENVPVHELSFLLCRDTRGVVAASLGSPGGPGDGRATAGCGLIHQRSS